MSAGDPVGGAPRGLSRVLFVGNTTYDLPLSPGLARKWDTLSDRMDLRVVGRAGKVAHPDPRFRLVKVPPRAAAGVFQALLAPVVAAEVRRFRPDVIIAQSAYEALPVLAACRTLRARPRIVIEVHGDWRTAARLYGSRPRRLFARVADRAALAALRRADGTRAVSGFTAGLAERATGHPPLGVFPAYMDLHSFRTEPVAPLPQRPRIAWVGVLQRYKAPNVFASAWREVARRVPDAELTMVGDGPLYGIVEALQSEFPERVHAARRLPAPEVARVLDESTVLALPSWAEGMGRVIIEAFMRGRPVVGSAAGGIPDLVVPERNGLLVPPGHPDRLADALVRVLSDRPFAERLAAGAQDDAPHHDWPADRYADAVRDLVERAARSDST